jgi:multicomponent Na+:H+ antiporter subunit F
VTTVYGAACLAELVISAALLVRVALGPTVSDRIVALNTMSTQATMAVLLFAAFADRTIYLDVAIWLASFSYLATIVWSRYLERGLL